MAFFAFGIGVLGTACDSREPSAKQEILVGAAASLVPLFTELTPLFESASGVKVTLVSGSSGALAQQIKAGAPLDVFASADPAYASLLTSTGDTAVINGQGFLFAEGSIVLISQMEEPDQTPWQEVLTREGVENVALANPELAPYGERARAALVATGLWGDVASRVVYGANVTQVLEFVRSGNAQVGFIALSQVRAGLANGLAVHSVDRCLHGSLDQVIFGVESTKHQELVEAFIAFVGSNEADETIKRLGYSPPSSRVGRPECSGDPRP